MLADGAALPATIGGKYRPIRLIGRGGMGAVYEVEHLHTGQHLALKLLVLQHHAAPGSVERFKREARASSRITSEHVVRVTDADVAPEIAGAPFLVMELLEGADLERTMRAARPSPADVVDWLRQVARALRKAHDLGIVHRDLKPENLFLTRREDGSPLVKILDFGIAKIVVEGQSQTQSGQVLGTPLFMAPEQADAGAGSTITPKTDLYSLGLIAFKLLVGRDYWNDGSIASLLKQIVLDPMVPASERGSTLGVAFDDWFAKACARDAAKRFASAGEEVEALATALGLPRDARVSGAERAIAPAPSSASTLETAPTLEASSTAITGPQPPKRRGIIGAIAGATAVGAVALVVALASRSSPMNVSGGAATMPAAAIATTSSTTSTATASTAALASAGAPSPSLALPSATPAPSASTTTSASAAKPGPPARVRTPVPATRPSSRLDPLGDQN